MAEEPMVATEETSNSTESAPETPEVTENVSEDAQTPQKSADEKYQQTLTALREERQKRKQKDSELEEVKARLAQLESKEEEPEEEEPKSRRQTKAEALSELAIKLVKDPGFKDRLDLVEEKMTQGMTLEQADNAVLADIARKMMSSSTSISESAPKSISPTAIPENPSPKSTGNVVKDAISGKLNIPQGQREAIARIMGELNR